MTRYRCQGCGHSYEMTAADWQYHRMTACPGWAAAAKDREHGPTRMTRKDDGQSLREAWANGHERGQEYVDTGVCRHCEPIGEPEAIARALRHDAAHLASGEPFDYQSATPWERGAYDQWSTTVLAIAQTLRAGSKSFDIERFLSACGYRGGVQ